MSNYNDYVTNIKQILKSQYNYTDKEINKNINTDDIKELLQDSYESYQSDNEDIKATATPQSVASTITMLM
jgi:hypothetical protein